MKLDAEKARVAVVVPVYKVHRTEDEEIALRHLEHFLACYDRYCLAPESLSLDAPGYGVQRFDDAFFESTHAYSRLLLSPCFYEAFAAYEFILIYQLDCLVFSHDLAAWCATGYDYIGAPWFKSKTDPARGFSRVGNGGLSLRKVASFLRVLSGKHSQSQASAGRLRQAWRATEVPPQASILSRIKKTAQVAREVQRGVHWYAGNYSLNEDHFWADRACLFDPDFEVAPVEVALQFAFERFPRYCFEQNKRRLPFGCHAWARWNRAFWEPHLLKEH